MPRARELGITIGRGRPGPLNAITDVPGVRVGHATIVEGDSVRTGVTMVVPHEGNPAADPVFAAPHRLNGNGELTGLEWVRENGLLTSSVGITNTYSVGVVRDALMSELRGSALAWGMPVVGETYDGRLNDIAGMHVRAEHAHAALAAAVPGQVQEGNVGGGTGMICHGFKGGIGTASRVLPEPAGGYTVGVLVQANHGQRARLRVEGVPVGELIGPDRIPLPTGSRRPEGEGSIIAIVATDAPLLPGQCARVAQRVSLGIGRMGGLGEHSSGDIFLAFATGNRGLAAAESGDAKTVPLEMYANAHISELFAAVVEATEEAILNALLAAQTMTGRDGITAHALPHDRLREALAGRA